MPIRVNYAQKSGHYAWNLISNCAQLCSHLFGYHAGIICQGLMPILFLTCISADPGDPAVQLLHMPIDRVLFNG